MHEDADYYRSSWYFEHCQEKLPFMCQATACLQGQFRCSNGRCINDARCDNIDDCQDMSDEANCSSECKQVQTGASGSISHTYSASESCQWVLQGDVGKRIKLTFSSFATEAQLDELQIWVGGPSLCSSRLQHRLSGSSVSLGPYFSDNNFMILVFHSDKDQQLAGFQATWTTETLDVDQELIASTTPAVLSSFMFGDRQISQSRNHWVIRGPSSANVITLEKVKVDLADGAYVTVQDGGDVSSPELARYTGKDGPDHVTSTGNRMLVYLCTQGDQGGEGFNFTYRLGCDVTVKASSGYIMSPGRGIGAPYPGSQVCTWRITAPTPQHMTMKFEGTFEFRQNEDNLTVYDGVDASGSLEFSSSTDDAGTAVITSSNGTLFVQMITNAIINLKGFKASFSVDCPDPMFNNDTQVAPSTTLTLGASIIVNCMDGYYFAQEEHINKSSVNMTCGLDGWNVRRTPQCERMYCGAIQYPDNAYVSHYTGAQYGDVVTFECYGGFALMGSQNVTCQQNGSWSDIPECQSSACPALIPFLNGNRSSNSTSYGAVVRYSCDPGYEIAGVASIYCKENGIWSDSEPTCTKLPCLVPSIEHGATDATGLVYFMDTVTVTCDPGFNGSTSMTCQDDQQFDSVPTCIDVDECTSGPCEFNCTNTVGNYTCSCDAGYEVDPLDRTKCADINECMVNNSNCMDTCNNYDGGYNCSCQQPGMVLYTQNGTSGFFIPDGETGLMSGDVYHINHTCVAKMCAVTPVLGNGTVLTQKTSFHYEDEVHFYCDLGFEMNGSSSATCQADGTWTALPTCQVATCDEVDLTSLFSPYKPTVSPSGPVTWGSKVDFTCTEHVNGTVTFSRECVYDRSTDSYRILPDGITCPVVDCGPLSSLTSLGGGSFNPSTPNHTFLGSSVEFVCPNTFALLGESILGNTTVTCGADGHWDLGTLRCKGPSCPNPGRPGDAEMYFPGLETLSVNEGIIAYNCSRPGYLLDNPYPRMCVLVGNQTVWNDTIPSCIDMEDPVLHGCPTDMIVNRLDAPGFALPNVTDNSNAIKNFTIDPPTFSPDKPLTQSMLVTFTAEDYAGNMASCQVNLTIRDESVPNITCPDAYTEYIQKESGNVLDFNGKATGLDNQGPVTVTYDPASLTVGKDDIGKSFAVLAVAVDTHDNNKTCQFMVTVEAEKCMDFSLPVPQNGAKNCAAQGTGYRCTMTCNSGYYFYDDTPGQYNISETSTTKVLEYICTNGTDWSPMADVPDCIEATQAAYVQENGLQYGSASLPVNLTECEAVYRQALVSDGPSVATTFQTTCRTLLTLTTIEVNFREDFVTFSSSGNQVSVNFGLEYGPASLSEEDRKRCATLVAALIGTSTVQVDKLVTLSGDNASCPDMSLSQGSTSSQTFKCTVDDTEKLVTVNGEHLCLKSPPGTRKLSGQDPVECEQNTYQNETGASTCMPCPDGKLTESTAARSLDECKLTCKQAYGMISATGLPPCMECPMNYYAYNATYCQECPAGMATMQPGATDVSQCLGACPAGSYSRTGFVPCQPCPVNFYQPDIAQTLCLECAATETTLSDGSISSANCTDANAVKCTQNPCINGACLIQDHDYYCQCQTGYTGKNCETMIDMCQSEPCYYGGVCTPLVNGYNCSCPTNYTGDNCENEPDDCASNDCSTDSVCLDLIGDFKCLCPSGYSGDKCDQKTSVCAGDPCNNGTCIPSEPVRAKCICDAGYTGLVCDTLIDKCTSSPCLYGGQCVNLVDDYRCDCPLGFSGKNCNIRPNFCGSTPCGASGECVNDYRTNSALCVCNPGYTAGLQNISWIQNITDMSVGTCDLVDNCSPDPCTNGGCSSHTGSYRCACTSGFEGSMCQHNVDDCAADPCLNGGTCKDQTDSYMCTCLAGFTGGTCDQNIDDCLATPCNVTGTDSSVHNAGCEDLINDYQCHCKPGFTGKDCQVDIDECASSPCLHNSTCIDEVNGYTCNCTAGWMGSRCQELVEKCDQNPCQNAAGCHNVFNDYFCRCPAQTYGKQCEFRTSFCTDSDPCIKPGGQCHESQGNTSCNCTFGYTGMGCEVSEDYCSKPDICSGEGKCQSTFNNFTCDCDKDYSGYRCEVHDDDCAASPCPAGVSTCVDLDNSYHCLCNVNKTGEMCDKEVDTNYNMTFHSCNGVSSARLRFPFRLTGSALTVGLWLKLSVANGVGTIFTLYGQREWSGTSDREEIIRLNTTHVTMNIGGNLEYVAFGQYPIDNGDWQYVSIVWTGSGIEVFKNPASVAKVGNYAVGSSLLPYGWVTLGSDWDSASGQPLEGSSFEGIISQLNIWNEGFDLYDHDDARRGNFPYDSLLQRWSGYLLDKGVQIIPNTKQDAAASTTAKVAPTITCPQPDMYLTDQRRTAKWWADPVVTNNDGNSFTTTHSRVTAYSWGKHEVSYAVTNKAGYRAACSFDVVIRRQNCSKPSEYRAPQKGAETCSGDRWPFRNCYVTCDSGYSPPMPIPNFYTCGPEGSFNVFNKFLPFQYLHCGRIFPPKRGLVITASYTVDGAQNQESIKTKILERIIIRINVLWNICKSSACTETVSMSINSSTRRRRSTNTTVVYKLTVNMQDLNETLTNGIDSLTPEEVMRMFVFDKDILDLTGEHVAGKPSLITINTQLDCDPGQGIVGNICVKCSPGTYAHNSSNTCKECPLGTYQDAEGQFSCSECGSDKTTELPGADNNTMCLKSCGLGEMYNKTSGDCSKCPKGYYQDETGQFYCKPCSPLNTTAAEGSKSSSDCFTNCQPGQFINSSYECEDCDYGWYQPESEKYTCLTCPNGTTTDFQGASNITDCGFYCPEGQEEDPAAPNTCRPCTVTGFKNNSLPFRTCQSCPPDRVSEFPGATHEDNCTLYKCLAGHQPFLNNSGCMPCPLGTYQPENYNKTCLPCPSSSSTRSVGAENLTQCEEYCQDGHEMLSGTCQPCQRGYYKNNTDGIFNMCELCPVAFITAGTGAKSLGECVVANCSAGERLTADNSSCVPCEFGFYQPGKWKSECIQCPPNMNTSTNGSVYENDCQFYCPPGSESRMDLGSSSNGSCVPCEIGTFKEMAGFLSCKGCPSPNITEVTGANSSSLCNLENCTAGNYLGSDRVCHPCPRGQYQPSVQQKTCEYCPQGSNGRNMTTPAEGAESQTDCILDCDSGQEYNSLTKQCDPCPIGKFRERGVNETCVPCPSGLLTPTVGSESQSACSVVKCPAGTEVDMSGQCRNCSIGTYQPDQDLHNQTCVQCPAGTTTMGEATTDVSQCLKDCGDGKELTIASGACVECPIGYYKTASQSFYCQLCSNGMLTPGTGSTSVASCTVANCTEGQYRDVNNQCQSCPDGTYQDKKWQTMCTRCPGIYEPVDYTTNGTGATTDTQCLVANTCKNQMHSCSSEQTCQYDKSTKTVSCLCRIGYNTVGTQCVHVCSQGYCMNGATCNKVSTGVGATCTCPQQWTGKKCETRAETPSVVPYIIGGSVGGIFGLLLLILSVVWCCWCTRSTPGTPKPVAGGPAVHAMNPTYEPIKGLHKPNQQYTGGLADSLGRTMPSMAQNGTMDQKSVAGYSHAPSKFLFYEDKDDPVRIAPHYTPSVAYSNFGGPGVYEEKTSVMDFVDEEEAILPGNTGTGIYATVEK